MPSTYSLTSEADGLGSTVASLVYKVAAAEYNLRGFYVKIDPTGVSVTKASSFGGSQSALTFPITRNEAKALAVSLLRIAE